MARWLADQAAEQVTLLRMRCLIVFAASAIISLCNVCL